MVKTLIAGVAAVALAGGAAWTAWPAPSSGGCRAPGAECCFPGSPCCGEGASSCAATLTSADVPPATVATVTVIAVEEMDCPSCAKQVVAKLNEVAGVGKAVADTKASKVSVTPKGKETPSARALWEAVKAAGFEPTKLEGPSGTFTTLPKE